MYNTNRINPERQLRLAVASVIVRTTALAGGVAPKSSSLRDLDRLSGQITGNRVASRAGNIPALGAVVF
jgi:hypothetical protein